MCEICKWGQETNNLGRKLNIDFAGIYPFKTDIYTCIYSRKFVVFQSTQLQIADGSQWLFAWHFYLYTAACIHIKRFVKYPMFPLCSGLFLGQKSGPLPRVGYKDYAE